MPVCISLFAYTISWNYLVFLIIILFPLAERGYGQPDGTDKGSSIGRFWFERLKEGLETRFNCTEETASKVNLATRSTIALFYALSLLPLLSVGTWIWGALFVFGNTILWSAVFEFDDRKIYDLNLEEILIGAGYGFGAGLACL